MPDPIEDVDETSVENDDTDNTDVDVQDDDEKLISQKDLDRILQKRLKRQEDQFKKQYADYDTLKTAADAYQKLQDEKATDSQRWEKERDKLVADLQERDENLSRLQRANLIADLASEKGLPKSFWKRVQGDTEDDISEDMDSIIEDLGLSKKPQGEGEKKTPAVPKKRTALGGGGETEDPKPDTDAIVAKIPRGPQIRMG